MREEPDFEAYISRKSESYEDLNYGPTLAARFLRRSHILAEKPFGKDVHFSRVLEVGSGTGIHCGFVRHGFDEYIMSDQSPDMLGQAPDRLPPDIRSKVRIVQEDATRLTLPDGSVDRLIATHVLEHIYRPHEVLREWNRVVRPGGVMSIVLPCDPGWLWRFGRLFGPRRDAERVGIAYDYWMAREHVNPIGNLVVFIRYYFRHLQETWYPLGLPSTDLNLFYVCTIRKPDTAAAGGAEHAEALAAE